jgi:hypothetical protein
LARRITDFVTTHAVGKAVEIYPSFAGCGVVQPAQGDILIGCDLYEVKAVDRTFRAIDVRQLLVYGALDFAKPPRRLRRVGLLNPFQGVWEIWAVDELCVTIGGLPASELFRRVITYVSSDLDATITSD